MCNRKDNAYKSGALCFTVVSVASTRSLAELIIAFSRVCVNKRIYARIFPIKQLEYRKLLRTRHFGDV